MLRWLLQDPTREGYATIRHHALQGLPILRLPRLPASAERAGMSKPQATYYWYTYSSIYHRTLDGQRTLCGFKVEIGDPLCYVGWSLTDDKPPRRTLCLSCKGALP